MNNLQLSIPVFGSEPEGIKTGQLVYIDTSRLYVFVWGKFRKYRWYHRLIFRKPIEVGIVKGVDTSKFKGDERLYLDLNIPGGMTNKKTIK